MKKKICEKCKIFVEGERCPICNGTDFVHTWKGRVFIADTEKSEIAKKVGFTRAGEYAIKVK